jgi:hypothetical protein
MLNWNASDLHWMEIARDMENLHSSDRACRGYYVQLRQDTLLVQSTDLPTNNWSTTWSCLSHFKHLFLLMVLKLWQYIIVNSARNIMQRQQAAFAMVSLSPIHALLLARQNPSFSRLDERSSGTKHSFRVEILPLASSKQDKCKYSTSGKLSPANKLVSIVMQVALLTLLAGGHLNLFSILHVLSKSPRGSETTVLLQ